MLSTSLLETLRGYWRQARPDGGSSTSPALPRPLHAPYRHLQRAPTRASRRSGHFRLQGSSCRRQEKVQDDSWNRVRPPLPPPRRPSALRACAPLRFPRQRHQEVSPCTSATPSRNSRAPRGTSPNATRVLARHRLPHRGQRPAPLSRLPSRPPGIHRRHPTLAAPWLHRAHLEVTVNGTFAHPHLDCDLARRLAPVRLTRRLRPAQSPSSYSSTPPKPDLPPPEATDRTLRPILPRQTALP
jgi:hypothetical protein